MLGKMVLMACRFRDRRCVGILGNEVGCISSSFLLGLVQGLGLLLYVCMYVFWIFLKFINIWR